MNALMDKFLGTLKKLHSTRISFTDGSYIEYFNREAILYVETSGRQMEIVWYFQPGRMKGRVLYTSDINYWDSPYEKEAISQHKKAEIQEKIVEYCKRRKIPLSIKEEREQTQKA